MKRLKYVSQFAEDLDRAAIDALIAHAAASNAALGITGILMSSGRMFYQVIEGPEAAIDGLFERIAADPRHQDVLLLAEETGVTERIFADWSLRKIDLDERADHRLEPIRDLLVAVLEHRLVQERLTHALERALWNELASAL
jgi:hypothetical protein